MHNDKGMNVTASLLERVADEEMGVIISVWRDVTKRKMAEEKLKKNHNLLEELVRKRTAILQQEVTDRKQAENRFRTFMDSATDSFFIFDSEMNYLDLKSEVFGVKRDDAVGKNIVDIVPGIKESGRLDEYMEVIKTGKPFLKEDYVPHPKFGNVRLNIKAFKVGDGLGLIVSDITEQKKTLKALYESTQKYENLFHKAPDMYVSVDPKTAKILDCNQTLINKTGYMKDEIIGRKVFDLYTPDSAEYAKSNVFPLFVKTGRVEGKELQLLLKDGRALDVSLNVESIQDSTGNILQNISCLRDITNQKNAERQLKAKEEQLQRSQKMDALGTLAGGIAHDFNNMLSVITGNVSYALSLLKSDEELFEVLSEVQEGTRQSKKLTQQLLTFAKGGAPIKKAADINQIIREAAQFVTRGTKTQCKFNLHETIWAAVADEGQINQVVSNLVINANQAMPDGGFVQVETENVVVESENVLALPPGRFIKVAVKDQGMGIPEKHLLKIFDPYFSTKQQGNGLGLTTSYSIIQKHGGHISAESNLGLGTTVYFYLPASEKTVSLAGEGIKATHHGQGKILVMDDQESILKIMGRILSRMGYETEMTTDGAQAIQLYSDAYKSRNPFRAVILDLTVPGGMGGAKTIPELLKINPKVKAVVSSGYSNDPIMANYKDLGFCGVVPKPYT
ncbi:PAS domain S-box protein, partial [Desulfobacterales bacterium HSG17]|nr:PAS domain S-box protein [Desulfobacterales bacterium HSG17]